MSNFHPPTPNQKLSTLSQLDTHIEKLSLKNAVSAEHLVRIKKLRSILADIAISVQNRTLILSLMGDPTSDLAKEGWHPNTKSAMNFRQRNSVFHLLLSEVEKVGSQFYPSTDQQLRDWETRVEHMRRENLNLSEIVDEAREWTQEECDRYGVGERYWDGWNGRFLVEKKGVFKEGWNFGDAWGKGGVGEEEPVSPKGNWDVGMEDAGEEMMDDGGQDMESDRVFTWVSCARPRRCRRFK